MKKVLFNFCLVLVGWAIIVLVIFNQDKILAMLTDRDLKITEHTLTGNVLHFKINGYNEDYKLAFKRAPIIQEKDNLSLKYFSKDKYIELYINDKLAYGKNDDIVFTTIYRDDDEKSIAKEISISNNKKETN